VSDSPSSEFEDYIRMPSPTGDDAEEKSILKFWRKYSERLKYNIPNI
jgi:hypothetical protein